MLWEKDVEVCGDECVVIIVSDFVFVGDEDWKKEYLDFIMVVKIVDDIDEVIFYINVYSLYYFEVIVIINYVYV